MGVGAVLGSFSQIWQLPVFLEVSKIRALARLLLGGAAVARLILIEECELLLEVGDG